MPVDELIKFTDVPPNVWEIISQLVPPLRVFKTIPLPDIKPVLVFKKNTEFKMFVVPDCKGYHPVCDRSAEVIITHRNTRRTRCNVILFFFMADLISFTPYERQKKLHFSRT
jgi:hypothetical protein